MIFSSHVSMPKLTPSAKHMSYRETICFASIPARARSGEQCCKAAAALNAPSRSVSSPVYSFVFRCRISLHKATCSSKAALTSFCVIWHPSFENELSRILYIIRDSLGARQVNPVVHQAHAGFVLPGNQAVGTFPVHSPFVLNLHSIRLIEAVFQVGNDTPQGLKRLPL